MLNLVIQQQTPFFLSSYPALFAIMAQAPLALAVSSTKTAADMALILSLLVSWALAETLPQDKATSVPRHVNALHDFLAAKAEPKARHPYVISGSIVGK